VEIGVAYTLPEDEAGHRSLDEALEVFDHANVRAVSLDHANVVADDARQALALRNT
jgi:hypothetical protein